MAGEVVFSKKTFNNHSNNRSTTPRRLITPRPNHQHASPALQEVTRQIVQDVMQAPVEQEEVALPIVDKATDLEVCKKLVHLQQSAENRGLEFNLDIKTVRKLLNTKKCYYTGEPLFLNVGKRNSRTIDRVDNEKGYVIGNVVACSRWFNEAKNNLTVNQVILLHKGLKKHGLIQ